MARNLQQTMALDLLLDDEVRLVSLIGPAGTGKTLMAIAAGLHKVFREERFDKLLVARPIMPLGRDIDEMLRVVDALQFTEVYGEVCPAGWKKGKAGMKADTAGVATYLAEHANSL